MHKAMPSSPLWLQVNPQSKGNTGAKWVDSKRSSHKKSDHIFSIDELLELLRFVINNSFVVNGGKIIKQICGIPMCTNSAPVANLYLYSYESEYMEKLNLDRSKYCTTVSSHIQTDWRCVIAWQSAIWCFRNPKRTRRDLPCLPIMQWNLNKHWACKLLWHTNWMSRIPIHHRYLRQKRWFLLWSKKLPTYSQQHTGSSCLFCLCRTNASILPHM